MSKITKIFRLKKQYTESVPKHQINEIVFKFINSNFEKIKKIGIKSLIEKTLGVAGLDDLIIQRIKSSLSIRRNFDLGHKLGFVDIQYKFNAIEIDVSGNLRYIIKTITITEEQIIRTIDNILSQIEDKYIKNSNYIMSRINQILLVLAEDGIYKPQTSEEKTLYDLILLILLNYYKITDDVPKWIQDALVNVEKGQFIEKWVMYLIDYISNIIVDISENIFFDFKFTFDSKILRAFLNKKTNKGQFSKLLYILNIDLKKIIKNISKNYISPSFITGFGKVLTDVINKLLSDLNKNTIHNKLSNSVYDGIPLQLTMTLGENPLTERNFCWYTLKKLKNIIFEYSDNQGFYNSIMIKPNRKTIKKPKSLWNLGIFASYSVQNVSKYFVSLKGLKLITKYYYRILIKDENKNIQNITKTYYFLTDSNKNAFNFIIFADSQGMIKKDYDIFLDAFACANRLVKKTDFIVHMGDFVDDGNNETYWQWLLNSDLWKQYAVVPLAGNHEVKISFIKNNIKFQNPIISHFYLSNLPPQDLSTGAYYSYTYKNALFIVLNTNSLNCNGEIDRKQYLWVLNTAKNSDAKWKILLTHKSPYSNGPHHFDKDVQSVGKQIIELAYILKIDIVIGGHDHVYVRTPVMNCDTVINSDQKIIKHKSYKYLTYMNPNGTIFIVPGTTGVKNYQQNMNIQIPMESCLDIKCPIFSDVEVTDDKIFFTAYKYQNNSASIIDSFAIEKSNNLCNNTSYKDVIKYISGIPDCPWLTNNINNLQHAMELYKRLDYVDKLKVYNYNYLVNLDRLNNSLNDIKNKYIQVVNNKLEFFNAINNSKIGTIIINCKKIKFENKFGKNSKCIINRNICIRGNSKLCYINFVVSDNCTLIIAENICIDNVRRRFSLYKKINAIELLNSSTLILKDTSTINCGYGIGVNSGYGIFINGNAVNVYLDSVSHSWTTDNFIFSNYRDCKIIVNSGKYNTFSKKYAFDVTGKLIINGGRIKNLRLGVESSCKILKGQIGIKNNHNVPIYSEGILKINSGLISTYKNLSIQSNGKNAIIIISPNHEGAVRVGDRTIYLGRIKYHLPNKIFIEIAAELDNLDKNLIQLCATNSEFDITKIKILSHSIKHIKSFDIDNFSKNIIIKLEEFPDLESYGIINSDGSKFYLTSKNMI